MPYLDLKTLTPDSGWATMAAEPLSLRGGKGQYPALKSSLFVGKINNTVQDRSPLPWKTLVTQDSPAGQVDAGEGLYDADAFFNWVPSALSVAELEDEDILLERDVLWCKGAAFHDDATFNKIFCVMHLDGEAGDLVFPRLNARVPMTPGIFVIFDCREPHAFLKPGATEFKPEDYVNTDRTFFAAQDLDPDNEILQRYFPNEKRRQVPRGSYGVNSATGAYFAI